MEADERRLSLEVSEHQLVEVSAPTEGVLRVRHLTCARLSTHGTGTLPPKRSFAVNGGLGEGLPISVSRVGADRIRVEAEGASLELWRDGSTGDLRWIFGEDRAECLCLRGEADVGYPQPRYSSELILRAPEGEAYLGFGEKTGPLDKRGMRFTFWNTDVLPHGPDTDPLYASFPFSLALGRGDAWGLFVDESARSEVDVAQACEDRVRWRVQGPEVDVYLIAGPTPLEVIARASRLTGRPQLPPLWSLGLHQSRWGYEGREEVLSIIDAYRAHELPLDCVHLDIDHPLGLRPLSWDTSRFGEPEDLVAAAAERGVKLVTIVDPAIPLVPGEALFEEAREGNHLVRDDRGEVLVGEVWPSRCVWPDFTRDEVRAFWCERHAPLLEAGIAGIWNDMNEPSCFAVHGGERIGPPPGVKRSLPREPEGKTLPDDARHGTRRHLEVHNAYASGMAEAAHAALRKFRPEKRPFVLTRAGFSGIARHAAMWTGDNSSHWEHLELSLTMLQGLGLSGMPFCGADVPGFLGVASGELMVRWFQAGSFYPFLRNHSARGTPPKEPWRFGERFLGPAREALLRRYRLLPELYSRMEEASRTGAPVMRPLSLHWPEDREALWAKDSFLFGDALLVAPVVRPGQTKRMVYLPRGRWAPFSNLREGERAHLIEGPAHLVVDAPLEVTPMFLRAGHGLALTAAAMHTSRAVWPELAWHLCAPPGGDASAELFEDEGDGPLESGVPWRRTRIDARWRDIKGGHCLKLVRTQTGASKSPARPERIHLHGLAALSLGGSGGEVAAVGGHAKWQEGALVVEPEESAWSEMTVVLGGVE